MAAAKIEHLSQSEERKDRGVIVENLPQGVEDLEEKLVIYFQSRKHGGGDVENVSVLDRTTAVVTFEDAEEYHTPRFPPWITDSYSLDQHPLCSKVFRCVMAEIEPSAFPFGRSELKNRLRELQRELRFNYREVSGNFLLTGNLQQISTAHDRLKESETLAKPQAKEKERRINDGKRFTEPGKVVRPAVAKSENELISETDEIRRKDRLPQKNEEEGEIVKTGKSIPIVPLVCKIKPEIMKFFIRLYKSKLEQIERLHNVQIRCEGRQSSVAVFPSEENPPNVAQFNRACDEFTTLFEDATKFTVLESISPLFDDEKSFKRLRQMVGQIQKRKDILVERGIDRTKWILYGKIEEVAKAKEEISKIIEIEQDGNSGEGRQDRRREVTGAPELTPRKRREMQDLDSIRSHSETLETYLPASVKKRALDTRIFFEDKDRNEELAGTRKELGIERFEKSKSRNKAVHRGGINSEREITNIQDLNSQQTEVPSRSKGSISESKLASRKPSYSTKSDGRATTSIEKKSKPIATLSNRKKTNRYLDNGFSSFESQGVEFQRRTDSDTTNMCSVCLGPLTSPVTLPKCKHTFCKSCIDTAFKVKKMCPYCKELYVTVEMGNQPRGEMTWRTDRHSLPGFSQWGRIIISYRFRGGVQGPEHYKPGEPYIGTTRCAYLPDNSEGWEVVRLLRKAFDERLLFTIGYSMTSLQPNQIVWADVEHKTNIDGGVGNFGYPDPDYLQRVKDQLASMGID